MTENPTNAVPNYHLLYQIVFWDSLPLPCNGVGHHTLEVRCLNWAYFSWESHYINFSLLLRYELLTPGVIPKGFMDGRKACQKMVCRFAGFTLFIKSPYFLVQFSIESYKEFGTAFICLTFRCHWSRRCVSSIQPINFETKTNRDLSRHFPRAWVNRYFLFSCTYGDALLHFSRP